MSDSKLLDIRSVQIQKMELLDDSIPIILVSCQTHEILLFRNKKGEIVVGQEDHIVTGQYMLAFAQQMQVDSDAEYNEETNGWIVLDWARGQH